MNDVYFYNKGTKILHINGFCCNARAADNQPFPTIDEVYKSTLGHFLLCKACRNKLDESIRKIAEQEDTKND